jgi:hypothetical protein
MPLLRLIWGTGRSIEGTPWFESGNSVDLFRESLLGHLSHVPPNAGRIELRIYTDDMDPDVLERTILCPNIKRIGATLEEWVQALQYRPNDLWECIRFARQERYYPPYPTSRAAAW